MKNNFEQLLGNPFSIIQKILQDYVAQPTVKEIGRVRMIDRGLAKISGLPHVQLNELIQFARNKLGIVLDMSPDDLGVILLDREEDIAFDSFVMRSNLVLSVPVGENLLGRVIDPMGRPLDNQGPIVSNTRYPIEREAPSIMERLPVTVPLETGIEIIDALIPIGRGQRELILGDRQTGKSAIAIEAMINQKGKDVISIYCSIGQQISSTLKIERDLKESGVFDSCILVVASGEDPPGLNFIAPYAATSMGEYFMRQGKDVLIIYDDLTHHANSYRELSLLLRRPPTREAFPGDIFYIHSRLLERATHLKSGGSLTALPIIETEAQNISAYIPTNLISITDGQIYLSPKLFQAGILPAIDIGKSVSRVGGKTQIPSFSAVAGNLKLIYSQFEELEMFSRFETRLEKDTYETLQRGFRMREILKQKEHETIRNVDQIAILFALLNGLLDRFPIDEMSHCKEKIQKYFSSSAPDICEEILQGKNVVVTRKEDLLKVLQEILNKE